MTNGARVYLSLTSDRDDFDPAELSLGIEPTATRKKGDPVLTGEIRAIEPRWADGGKTVGADVLDVEAMARGLIEKPAPSGRHQRWLWKPTATRPFWWSSSGSPGTVRSMFFTNFSHRERPGRCFSRIPVTGTVTAYCVG